MRVAVIVVAAGRGTRLGADRPKALVPLAGEPLITHALRRIAEVHDLARVVVVHPPGGVEEMRAALPQMPCPVELVPGGAERSDSVRAGLAAAGEADVVLVHDAARCLAPASLFDAVAQAVAAGHPAVVPGFPVVDTVKVVDESGLVVATPERRTLRAVQTPQGFARATLDAAHASGLDATDDAALVEALGVPVLVIGGDPAAAKVTTPEDLARAEREVAR